MLEFTITDRGDTSLYLSLDRTLLFSWFGNKTNFMTWDGSLQPDPIFLCACTTHEKTPYVGVGFWYIYTVLRILNGALQCLVKVRGLQPHMRPTYLDPAEAVQTTRDTYAHAQTSNFIRAR